MLILPKIKESQNGLIVKNGRGFLKSQFIVNNRHVWFPSVNASGRFFIYLKAFFSGKLNCRVFHQEKKKKLTKN